MRKPRKNPAAVHHAPSAGLGPRGAPGRAGTPHGPAESTSGSSDDPFVVSTVAPRAPACAPHAHRRHCLRGHPGRTGHRRAGGQPGGGSPFGTSRSARPTPTGSCCRPTSGSSRSAPGCWSTTAALLSSSISPNGQYLAALTWNDFTGFLTIINLKTGQVIQQVGTGAGTDKVIGDGTVAADGPLWSANGTSLWFPQTSDLVHFTVAADGTVSSPVVIPLATTIINLTTGNTTVPDGPSGMALSPDGTKLYVALNVRQPARRHRHGDQQADQGHQGRQRAPPGGAGRQHRVRL